MRGNNELDGIRATVQKYIDGIANSDLSLVAEAFHPDATMSGHFATGFRVSPAAESIISYMKKLPPTREHSPEFQGRIVDIRRDGSMAAVTIAEHQLQGKNFITHFHLHETGGRWLITAKATYAEPGRG